MIKSLKIKERKTTQNVPLFINQLSKYYGLSSLHSDVASMHPFRGHYIKWKRCDWLHANARKWRNSRIKRSDDSTRMTSERGPRLIYRPQGRSRSNRTLRFCRAFSIFGCTNLILRKCILYTVSSLYMLYKCLLCTE